MNPQKLRPLAQALLRAHKVKSARSINLAKALAQGRLHVFTDGEILCSEGTRSEEMFVLVKGTVRVLRQDVTGNLNEITRVGSPSFLGQMGLVDGSSRSATCLAKGRVSTIVIDREVFDFLMNDASPAGSAFRHQLMFTMMNQLNDTNQKIGGLIVEMEKEDNPQQPEDGRCGSNFRSPRARTREFLQFQGQLEKRERKVIG
jgi:CRP-like cAMP-binding protein